MFEPNKALEADYAAAGFGGSLGFGERPCVLVVDMCKAYVTAGSPLNAGCEAAYESAARVVAMARQCGHPVVFTKVELQAGGTNGGLFSKKVKALACFERLQSWPHTGFQKSGSRTHGTSSWRRN